MIRKIKNNLFKYSDSCSKKLTEMSFLLALSGGMDSMVLAHLLIKLKKKLNFTLFFIHIDHNYTTLSRETESFVRAYSKNEKIKLFSKKITIPTKDNFESASRDRRYEIFYDVAKKYNIDCIFTAHHKDDQIETIFMKIEDGADWISKIGIRSSVSIIRRPFLDFYKNEIKNYTLRNNIKWIEDPSNKDTSFRRNNIRVNKLPELLKENDFARHGLLEIAKKNAKKFIITIEKIKNLNNTIIFRDDNHMIVDSNFFHTLSIEEMKLFFYFYFERKFKFKIRNKSRHFWQNLFSFILIGKSGKFFYLDSLLITKNKGNLLIMKSSFIDTFSSDIPLKDNVDWCSSTFNVTDINRLNFSKDKNNMIITNEIFESGLKLRTWQEGDRMISSNTSQTVLLSDLFINNKFSFYEKKMQPIVVNYIDEIIWVPGLLHAKITLLKSNTYKLIKWNN